IRHSGFRVFGSDAGDQLRGAWIARHNGSSARLSHSERFLTVYEGNAVLLAHSAVALYAVLVQDRPDVGAEMHLISAKQRELAVPQQEPAESQGSSNRNPHQSPASDRRPAQHNLHISSTNLAS